MMGYDAMASAPSSIPRDLGKKKRGNRTAKLKQCKLDARREQWLSQANKEGKGNGSLTANSSTSNPPLPQTNKMNSTNRERNQSNESVFLHEMSDSDSSFPSPNSNPSNNGRPISSNSSVGSSSISTCDPDEFPEEEETNTNPPEEEEDEEDDALDDWEAVADALTDQIINLPNQTLKTEPLNPQNSSQSNSKKTEPVRAAPRAWRPDDTFRPQSLPSIQMNYHSSKGILSMPSSCPICYEDLDSTDSSFLPCMCGFRLCLFCHKRILEADARCPGCRKKYENVVANRLSRSCSMNSRY